MSYGSCPLCGARGWRYNTSIWRSGKNRDKWQTSWDSPGEGQALCNKCIKTRQAEIVNHNRLAWSQRGDKKDPNCKHDWAHAYMNRWVCVKCGAAFNWMCGCGGSAYVCQKHYDEGIQNMVKECGSVEAYLDKNSH